MSSKIKVSAPGSVMLMGEHAVVKGHWAIACAVDKYIEVVLTPRVDRIIKIDSALAQYSASLDALKADKNLTFVLKVIELQLASLKTGFELKITAQFSHTLGLGSSAAVTVATVKALAQYTQQVLSKQQHLQLSLSVVHAVQGRGSGTDLAASIYGGIIAYQIAPCSVENLPLVPQLSLHYAGYKTTTATVLALVAKKEQQAPALHQAIYELMNSITVASISAIKNQQWVLLGELMNMYQGQLDSLGVNDAALSDIVYQLRSEAGIEAGILGAKISGSGLGDCVISLGCQFELDSYQQIEFNTSSQGTVCHEC
ncbi:MAG: mevalonate kinase [Oceanospirillaceae bacterium]|jgi:mevalonate kinase